MTTTIFSTKTTTIMSTNYSRLDSKALLNREDNMSTILCIISVKHFALMIMIAMIVAWIAATKYTEAKQKQREQENEHKVAIMTTITILAGQASWWAIKKLRSRILYAIRVKKEMEPKPRP